MFDAPAGQPGEVHIVSAQNMDLVAPHFHVSQTTLEAVEGVVRILQGVNSFFETQTKSSNLFWQKQGVTRDQHKTFTALAASGRVTVKSKETVLQAVHGKALECARWVDQQAGTLTTERLREFHDHFHESHSGPTAALGMVIALGVTLALQSRGQETSLKKEQRGKDKVNLYKTLWLFLKIPAKINRGRSDLTKSGKIRCMVQDRKQERQVMQRGLVEKPLLRPNVKM